MPYINCISFKFDARKFTTVMAYLAGRVADLTKLRAAKLLFYIDKMHLLEHGRPVLGDLYIAMDLGPAPSISLNIMDEVLSEHRQRIKLENRKVLDEFLSVSRDSAHPVFHAKKAPDLSLLSDSEKQVIEEVISAHGKKTITRLINDVHREPVWRNTPRNTSMDYRQFFDEGQKQSEAYALMEHDQEDHDLVQFLNV
jgi:uncharacterized phage-associated protein